MKRRTFSLKVFLMLFSVALALSTAGSVVYANHKVAVTRALLNDTIGNDLQELNALQDGQNLASDLLQSTLKFDQTLIIPSLSSQAAASKAALVRAMADIHTWSDSQPSDLASVTTPVKNVATATEEFANTAARQTPAQREAAMAQLDSLQNDLVTIIDQRQDVLRGTITSNNQRAQAVINQLIWFIILAALSIIGVTIVFGSMVARSVVNRLSRLREAANSIANGDLSKNAEDTGKDELGQVAAAFNQMATRLRDSYARIALEKQRDDTLLESIGEGLVAIDQQGTIVLINSSALKLIGQPDRFKLVGHPLAQAFELFSLQDLPVPLQDRPGTTTLRTGQSVTDVYTFHRPDGKKILVNNTANPIVLDGQVAGAIIILRDVTKEREVDRMKTEFISLASHQLRTPLSAIKWFSEMLLAGDAGELKPEQAEFTRNITESTQRMIELVNSLLNISRIESGRIIVDPKPTDLGELVNGIISDLKAKTEEKQQSLIVSVHDGLPKINLDPHLIGQVYMNFLTNAIKYTPKSGEISVFISKKDDQVISQITDNGYGIPKSQHDRIFQKFFRAENIVKFETDGTGLGLYLVKAIIESSGGKVWFESEEGKGTTFWFSIPLSGMKAKEGEVTLDM